jgi:hypothetical protein
MLRLPVCAVLGATGLFALSANAAILSDLVGKTYNPADPTTFIKVGDKIFTEFEYAFTGDMPAASGVTVDPVITDLGAPLNQTAWGIRFTGPFTDLPGGGASDGLITYTVLVDSDVFAISDAHIAASFTVTGAGNATITETWLPDNASAVIRVFNLANDAVQLTDNVNFLPTTYKVIHAQKDILVDAGPADTGTPGSATINSVDQLYTQIPEPASLSLLALGGAALLIRRKHS